MICKYNVNDVEARDELLTWDVSKCGQEHDCIIQLQLLDPKRNQACNI
jgi:hypothetical protein